jgi:hypothetical protein
MSSAPRLVERLVNLAEFWIVLAHSNCVTAVFSAKRREGAPEVIVDTVPVRSSFDEGGSLACCCDRYRQLKLDVSVRELVLALPSDRVTSMNERCFGKAQVNLARESAKGGAICMRRSRNSSSTVRAVD